MSGGQTGEIPGRRVDRPGLVRLDGAAEEGRLEPVSRAHHAAVGGNVGRRPGQQQGLSTTSSCSALDEAGQTRHETGGEGGGGGS